MDLREWIAAGIGITVLLLAIPIVRAAETHDYHRDADRVSNECMRRLGLR